MFNKQYPVNTNNNKSVYFLRNTSGMVPVPNTVEEAELTMSEFFDYGILNAHPLYMLNQVLTKVYTPLLSYRSDHVKKPKAAITNGDEKPAEPEVEDEKEIRV